MEQRLGPTVLICSAHGQASWGSEGNALWEKKNLARFVTHCVSCVQDVENAVLVIKVFYCCCRSWETETLYYYTLYFSIIIVKSLQFRGRRQIAEPRKYYLVRVIIFLWRDFLFLTGWEFRVNSLHLYHEFIIELRT